MTLTTRLYSLGQLTKAQRERVLALVPAESLFETYLIQTDELVWLVPFDLMFSQGIARPDDLTDLGKRLRQAIEARKWRS